MKHFESGKNATELGIDITRRFVVVTDIHKDHGNYAAVDDILIINRDDNTTNPFFNNINNKERGYDQKICISWDGLAYYADEVEPKKLDFFKVGDRVVITKGELKGKKATVLELVDQLNKEVGLHYADTLDMDEDGLGTHDNGCGKRPRKGGHAKCVERDSWQLIEEEPKEEKEWKFNYHFSLPEFIQPQEDLIKEMRRMYQHPWYLMSSELFAGQPSDKLANYTNQPSDNGGENNLLTKVKHMVQNIPATLKRFLNADLQEQYKAGFRNGDLSLTGDGKSALLELVSQDYEAKLGAVAKERNEEAKKECDC